MNRILSVLAGLLLTLLSLLQLRAQEPPPAQTHAQTKGETKSKPAEAASAATAKTG